MHLINCHTGEVEETVNPETVRYAILSHTWEEGQEVTFKEYKNGSSKEKRGWVKVEKTIELARADGCDFVWMDTCLIDKKSSAELEEAINSMFSWYRKSSICYVYLSDHDASTEDDTKHGSFSKCNYWMRGWTLQELLAPAEVRFYDRNWHDFGSRDSMSGLISNITSIPQYLLSSSRGNKDITEQLAELPVAVRMAWAADRITKRPEDIAYCLLGIFQVNIRMIYGEGEQRAFFRLQEEIVRNGNDLSILAWLDEPSTEAKYTGVFASHPRAFHRIAALSPALQLQKSLKLDSDHKYFPEVSITTKGLKIAAEMGYDPHYKLHYIGLQCHWEYASRVKQANASVGIYLKHQGASLFARAKPTVLAINRVPESNNKEIYLDAKLRPTIARDIALDAMHRGAFHLSALAETSDWVLSAAKPEHLWDDAQSMFITAGCKSFVGYVEYRCTNVPSGLGTEPERRLAKFFILFGFEEGKSPWVSVYLAPHPTLDRQVARGNWPAAAKFASTPSHKETRRRLHGDGQALVRVRVYLQQLTLNGQPVHHINWSVGK